MTKVICKECNRSVPEGVCCDYCGALLDCAEGVASAPPLEAIPEEVGAEQLNEPVSLKSMEPDPVTDISSADIELSYNNVEFSVVGLDDSFNISIKAGREKLTNLCVYAEHQCYSGPQVVGKTKELWNLRSGQSRSLSIAYTPRREGIAVYCFYVVFKRGDELCCLESEERTIAVYPPEARARDAIHNLSINIKNEIRDNQGHANDYKAAGTLDGLDKLIQRVSPSDDIKSVIKEIANCVSFVKLELYASNWRPAKLHSAKAEVVVPIRLSGSAPNAGCKALTFQFGGRCVHLFDAGTCINIGRSRNNQVVTRHIAYDGSVDNIDNKKISRCHCRIERSGQEIRIQDASAWGTWLDGNNLSGSGVGAKKQSFVLTLAGESPKTHGVFALKCELWTCGYAMQHECRFLGCGGKRETSSIILKRMDAQKESHVGLWRCCDMRSVDEQLAGLVVWRQDGGFGYATATGSGWLCPGIFLVVGGKPVEVREHSPLGCR